MLLYLLAPQPVGCQRDEECSVTEACQNTKCVNPCTTVNPCADSALCQVISHRAQCTCPDGYTGDPFRNCYPSKLFAINTFPITTMISNDATFACLLTKIITMRLMLRMLTFD
jgi:hypothetical protein